MAAGKDSPWTDEKVAKLRVLWAEGHSASEIGRRLFLGKDSIIGKAHRIKLVSRPSPLIADGPKAPPRKRVRPNCKPTLYSSRTVVERRVMKADPAYAAEYIAPTPVTLHPTHTCLFPLERLPGVLARFANAAIRRKSASLTAHITNTSATCRIPIGRCVRWELVSDMKASSPETKQKAFDLYDTGMSLFNIGMACGVSYETVRTWLKAAGIDRRSPTRDKARETRLRQLAEEELTWVEPKPEPVIRPVVKRQVDHLFQLTEHVVSARRPRGWSDSGLTVIGSNCR